MTEAPGGPVHQLRAGIRGFLSGLRLLRHPQLRRFVWIPVLINTVVFGVLIWALATSLGNWVDQLLPSWLDWLRWLVWPLFALAVLVVCAMGFGVLMNWIGAPFNGVLAERAERLLAAADTSPSAAASIGYEVLSALGSELRKTVYFLLRSIPLGLLFLVPGPNLLAPAVWFLWGAWMAAIEYVDYPLGNHGRTFAAQREWLRARRWAALGFGGAVLVAMMIPVLNLVMMPAAVIGATVLWVEEKGSPDEVREADGIRGKL